MAKWLLSWTNDLLSVICVVVDLNPVFDNIEQMVLDFLNMTVTVQKKFKFKLITVEPEVLVYFIIIPKALLLKNILCL